MLAISEEDFLLGHSSMCPLHMKFYVGISNNYCSLLEQFNVLGQGPRPNILFWALAPTCIFCIFFNIILLSFIRFIWLWFENQLLNMLRHDLFFYFVYRISIKRL